MINTQELEDFGLTDKEAKIYLASLELGPKAIQEIAQKAGIHRVSAYDIVNSLLEKGFLIQNIRGKKRYFSAISPADIQNIMRDKEKRFDRILPELFALENKGAYKPKVMFFEGRRAVWQAYFDRIRHEGVRENLVFGSSEALLKGYPKEYKEFTRERLAKEIKTKIIVERSKSGLVEKRYGREELRKVKFLPEGTSLKSNIVIYGNRVMIVSWETMMSVIIEDSGYATSQKEIFDLLWKYLP